MFKTELDGMYHREQIQDYIREADLARQSSRAGAHAEKLPCG
ncbi:MAG TPA: hypothetical protein VIX58_13540 [Anaerolineae bacterium]